MSVVDLFINQTIAGISIAGILVFASVGLSLIFGMTRIVNFAHGVLFMLGGMFTSALVNTLPEFPGVIWLSAFVLAPLGVVVCGFIIQRIVEIVRDRPEETFTIHSLLITLSISLIAVELTKIIFGVDVRLVKAPVLLRGRVSAGGFTIGSFALFIILLTVAVIGVLWYLIEKTRYGMAVRASLFNPEMTSALGNDVDRLRTSVFALGSYLAGLGGALYAISILVTPGTSNEIILQAFLVTVIGGLGSFWGVLVGAGILGLTRSYTTALGFSNLLLVVPFVIVMIVLYLRPQGLYGRARE